MPNPTPWVLAVALAFLAAPAAAQDESSATCEPCDSHAGATYEDGTPCADCLDPRPTSEPAENGAGDTVADCGADGCAYPTLGDDEPTYGDCGGEICAFGEPIEETSNYGDCTGDECAYYSGVAPEPAKQAPVGVTAGLFGLGAVAVVGLVALRRRSA